MGSKNLLKFAIDIVLGVVFALLFNHHVLGGLMFHEIAGLAVGGGVVVHVLLNAKWVRKVTASIFDSKTPAKTRLEYAIDVLLVIDLLVIIVTGVLISKVLLPSVSAANPLPFAQSLHISASCFGLALIGVHVGLHRQWIIAVVRKIFNIEGRKVMPSALMNIAMVCVLLCGMFAMASSGFVGKSAMIFHGQGAAAAHGGNHGQGAAGNSGGAELSPEEIAAKRAAHSASVDTFEVASTHLLIMGAFAVATGYAEIGIKKTKGRSASANRLQCEAYSQSA